MARVGLLPLLPSTLLSPPSLSPLLFLLLSRPSSHTHDAPSRFTRQAHTSLSPSPINNKTPERERARGVRPTDAQITSLCSTQKHYGHHHGGPHLGAVLLRLLVVQGLLRAAGGAVPEIRRRVRFGARRVESGELLRPFSPLRRARATLPSPLLRPWLRRQQCGISVVYPATAQIITPWRSGRARALFTRAPLAADAVRRAASALVSKTTLATPPPKQQAPRRPHRRRLLRAPARHGHAHEPALPDHGCVFFAVG